MLLVGRLSSRLSSLRCVSFKSKGLFTTASQPFSSSSGSSSTSSNQPSSLASQSIPGSVGKDDRSKETLFMNSQVQSILKKITGYHEEKIFSNRPVSGYKPPKYLFLTDEELELTRERARKEGQKSLQMPPVMDPWEDKDHILAEEPEFRNFDSLNLVITDLSLGYTDRTRLIAVREPNGTLRRARWAERYRANQVYFPVPGRGVEVPKMFEPENLSPILNRHDYQFVLNRACIQFEPDDPQYINIVQTTYDHINSERKFDLLRSTRHFGPMAFYLAFEGKIDSLLQDMIQRELPEDACNLIQLYYLVNPSRKRQPIDPSSKDPITIIKDYLRADCKDKYQVDKVLKVYEEIIAAREGTTRVASNG